MDFFSAARHGQQPPAPTDDDNTRAFADAIAARYGDVTDQPFLRLTPVPDPALPRRPAVPDRRPPPPEPPVPAAMPPAAAPAPTPAFAAVPVPPAMLDAYLADPATLIVDIRPHAAYASARIPHALSLSVPSTLLKRPLFSLARLAAMLPSPAASARFSAWPSAARILVYDADACAIPDSSNISGLLRKFNNDAFQGELAWLHGGFQAVWRDRKDLIDISPPSPEPEADDDDDSSGPILKPKHLPMSAFSLSSTTAASSKKPAFPPNSLPMSIPLPTSQPISRPAFNPFFDTIRQNVELSHGITERIPLRLPRRVRRRINDLPFPWLREIARRAECAPKSQHRPSRNQHNHHHHHHHHHLLPTRTFSPAPSSSSSDLDDSSDSDTSPDPAGIEEGTEALAMQFYRIELAEQRRLMGVMEHHSKESGRFAEEGLTQASLIFPFSITAGVEKGAKNRYRHIWPFEHARVRLNTADDDDYVNASYVQPLGTTRRYIATQGPLPATFNDFWTLCWEQNVHVIVMLTREIEGSMVKCGTYWVDDVGEERAFGPLTLRLVHKVGLPGEIDLSARSYDASQQQQQPQETKGPTGGFFGSFAPPPDSNSFSPRSGSPRLSPPHSSRRHRPPTTIKRTFELRHAGHAALGARRVVHLQYLEWPDMNVPEDARGVLGLVREVEAAVEETWVGEDGVGEDGDEDGNKDGERETQIHTQSRPANHAGGEVVMDARTGIAQHALGGKARRPVLLHCSAGVGRTGGFIAVDAVLDAVRREMRAQKRFAEEKERAMEVEQEVEKQREEEKVQVTRGYEGGGEENAMDVDTKPRLPDIVTVPIPVGGEGPVLAVGPLVVHVPAVVIPSPGDEADVPMQVDVDGDARANRVPEEGAATQKWAETVLDQTGGNVADGGASEGATSSQQRHKHHGHHDIRFPPTSNTFSSSSSTSASLPPFPSTSDSDDSVGVRRERARGIGAGAIRAYRESSSLDTSVSGASEGEGGKGKGLGKMNGKSIGAATTTTTATAGILGTKRTESPLSMGSMTSAEKSPLSHSFGEAEMMDSENEQQQHRSRTFSAPQTHSHMRNGGGIGSSPLATSSTPWSLDERGRGARQFTRPTPSSATAAGMSSDGEPPSRSISPSADESAGGGGASISSRAHSRAPRHPLSKSSPPLVPPIVSCVPDKLVSSSFQPRTTVDYKEPRRLHEDVRSPAVLSTYEEPIWEVVQDMREQRMSLCQSLRQYVFVHAAIIEGALMIVDEERAKGKQTAGEKDKDKDKEAGKAKGREARVLQGRVDSVVPSTSKSGDNAASTATTASSDHFSFGAQTTWHTSFVLPPPPMSFTLPQEARASLPLHTQHTNSPSEGSMASSASTGKRGASPTELLKEGKKGEVLLSKRPSIKRKHVSDQEGVSRRFQGQQQQSQVPVPVMVPGPGPGPGPGSGPGSGNGSGSGAGTGTGTGPGSGTHMPLLGMVPSSPPILLSPP